MKKTIQVIGMGGGGITTLSQRALKAVEEARVLVGGKRLLAFFADLPCEKVPINRDIPSVLKTIKKEARRKKVAVLLSGDPFFFGMGKRLVSDLTDFRLEFFPYPSSIQTAFARIGENWDDACLTSVHSRELAPLLSLIKSHDKIGILTDRANTPAMIAGLVLDRVGDIFTCHVCENLEGRDEKITKGSLRKTRGMKFSPLNVVILIRKKKKAALAAPFAGVSDAEFIRHKARVGMITKSEVRAVVLSKLAVTPGSIVWDVGAGTGSVSIEAASFARLGKVFAVEKDEEFLALIKENALKFSMPNVIPVRGEAPGVLSGIPDAPDALFVGGTGKRMSLILKKALVRLRPGGRFVINVVTLENLEAAIGTLKKMGHGFEIISLGIGRSRGIKGMTMIEGLNPVFIVYGRR